MLLKMKINNPNAIGFYKTKSESLLEGGDAGLDLYCPDSVTIAPGETAWIDLGISCEAETDCNVFETVRWKQTAFYIYPRSSLSKTPLRLANSVGIIDAGYRGNLILALDNIKTDPYTIQKGQRLAQICAPNLESINLCICQDLSTSDRGAGGFGSTGT
jgi:dUTP pyrophosphatase